MAEFMRVNGMMIIEVEKDLKDFLMETVIKENTKIIEQRERVFIHGKMEKFMMVSSSKE